MSDYDLYYWPVPFRGQFVRAVLASAAKTWTEGDAAATTRLIAGPVKHMLIPFMGPPLLVDKKADFAIAEMPAIVLYLGETPSHRAVSGRDAQPYAIHSSPACHDHEDRQ